ncbi:hypothetical protein E4A49_07960 [Micrococcus lylae]|uniref:Cytochrome b561 bacterial/Ni-hydrogenase domain-containing protein n=2 Tax=Micrococcus lylae TaxID=1273 RepID=A0ABY2JYP6_9MICC|nr:hypothetical protein E4A49_07960 [Micrococcus lylae]
MAGLPPLPTVERPGSGTSEGATALDPAPAAAASANGRGAATGSPLSAVHTAWSEQPERRRMGGASTCALTDEASAARAVALEAPAPEPAAGSFAPAAAAEEAPAAPAATASETAAGTGQRRLGTPAPAPSRVEKDATGPSSSTREGSPEDRESPAPGAGGRWRKPLMAVGGVVLLGLILVLAARGLRSLDGVQEFIRTYDGHSTQPESAPVGMPWWLGWQHFFNMFLMVLVVRTGLQIRHEQRPPGYWKPKQGSFFSPGSHPPKKISLTQWLHQSLDVLWVLNGLVFFVLLFATGHWMRIVPTSWDVFPNMLSAGLQYLSLDWPAENGWVHYNALQVTAYFLTVFVAAPIAVATGLRMSTWWPTGNERLSKAFPVETARALHMPTMLYFVLFTVVHVALVFLTGALTNLNHMYTSRPEAGDAWGLLVFLASLAVIAAGWFLTKPLFVRPVAERLGQVTKN